MAAIEKVYDLMGHTSHSIAFEFYSGFLYTVNLILWIAPLKAMYNLYKSNDIWLVPYNFYMLSIINCLFWIIYGIQIDEWAIWAINIPGLISFSLCILAYLSFMKMNRFEFTVMCIGLPFKLGVVYLLCSTFLPHYVNGLIAMIANTIMYLTPIESIHHCIKGKTNVYIELWLALAVCLNTTTWFFYGFMLSANYDILIPNGVGFIVSLVQLYVWKKYRVKGYGKVFKNEHDGDTNDSHELEIDTSID